MRTGDINECCGSDQYDWACFTDGVYELTACDAGDVNFYNDWYVEINFDNSWTSIYASELENAGIYGDGTDYGCYSEYFTVNSTIGCMDPAALDYDPYAVYQIEECLYPCSDTEQFLIVDINSWSSYQLDGSQLWEVTNSTGEVVINGVVEYDYDNDCSPYCGEVYCVPSEECYTITTSGGSWDGYVSVSQEWTGTGCNGCTEWITDVYSDSSSDFCLESSVSNCADGEVEVYTYGSCEDISYTLTYADGTVLDMLYNSCYSTVYECIPEGDYTVCMFTEGETNGWMYFEDWYFDACQINGTCGSGSGGQACQGSAPCEDGFNYYVYTYTNDNNCSVERTFTISDIETGDVVWSQTMSPCNSNDFHCLFTIR